MRDALGDRIKNNYENITRTRLVRRMPVAIRIDGKAFHTWTRGLMKPFDHILMKTMQQTTLELCKHVQNCVLGYTQSDEITLVLIDYKKFETQSWFDNELQKIVSISASLATGYFNFFWAHNVENLKHNLQLYPDKYNIPEKTLMKYTTNCMNPAFFDSRAFNIPREEVCNMIYWRQSDATRNSIQLVGQANFSHKELQNKSCNDIQNMLLTERNINWNDFSIPEKRGTAIIKKDSEWIIDENMPILLKEDRNYVESLLMEDDN